jgi:hypothetical protein
MSKMELVKQSVYSQLFSLKEFLPKDLSQYCAWFLCWVKLREEAPLFGFAIWSEQPGLPSSPGDWEQLRKHWPAFRQAYENKLIPVRGRYKIYEHHRLVFGRRVVQLDDRDIIASHAWITCIWGLRTTCAFGGGRTEVREILSYPPSAPPMDGELPEPGERFLLLTLENRAQLFLTDPVRALR